MDLATKALLKAHANVPDGKDMALQVDPDDPNKVVYSFTDADGKTVLKGNATPKDLASQAMGLAKGGFDKAILTAAGQAEQGQQGVQGAGAGAGGGKPAGAGLAGEKSSDRKGNVELIDKEVQKITDAYEKEHGGEGGGRETIPQSLVDDLTNAAQHIMKGGDVTHGEAVKLAQKLLVPPKTDLSANPKTDPGKPSYSVTPVIDDDQDTGMRKIRFDNGKVVTMSAEALAPFEQSYKARVKVAEDKIGKDIEDKEASDESWRNTGQNVKQSRQRYF